MDEIVVVFESIIKELHFDIDPIDDVELSYRIDVIANRLNIRNLQPLVRCLVINRVKESLQCPFSKH